MIGWIRTLLVLVVIAAAGAIATRHAPHHEADNVFTTLYMHVIPAPLVAAPAGHGPDAPPADVHERPGLPDELEGHPVAHGGEHDLLASIPLPGFLGAFDMDPVSPGAQLVPTNLQIFQIAAVVLCFVLFLGLASQVRSGRIDRLGRVFSGWAMWIRDEMVYPVMGRETGRKFLPFFLALFFFIVFMNLLGLVPHGATATASIAVTGGLAAITLAVMIGGGMVVQGPIAFWKNLVPHVPLALWPLMFLVEVVGLVVKPFALMVRLFANMTGGHMVVLSFMALIFFFAAVGGAGLGYATSPVAVAFAAFIMIIEAFIALLQAYIFTMLSILFVGSCLHPEH